MILLKNVSKYYYSKGVIATGFSKVNLEFKIGEFVAITGESGSGKSTLLNVISGLDSYEEGEMYINGEETSHYTEKDFEDYRRKYIGNIFQSFNLVNSYTVYQNIELVLLLNGAKKKDIKKKVLELIKQVDLYRFRNTKVSKLSGGQKQRVAIARALAKNTPIIIADEPTGNLDSKSATGIIKLLSEIAKDKLVIIVTHNYEQVENYVTRKIKMHDGKILEDKIIKEVNIESSNNNNAINYQNITFLNKIRLGLRNTFNIIPKFVLLFAVYLFVVVALMSEYAAFKKEEHQASIEGYNSVFNDYSPNRIVVNKKDRTAFSDDDFNKILNNKNVVKLEKNDVMVDDYIEFTNDKDFYVTAVGHSLSSFDLELSVGRMPENDNEIIITGYKNDYYLSTLKDEIMNTDLYWRNYSFLDKNTKIRIVGISYVDYEYQNDNHVYLSEKLLNKIMTEKLTTFNDTRILFMNNYYESSPYNSYFKLVPNSRVPSGKAIINSELRWSCEYENCINKKLKIEVSNIYYEDTMELTIANTYDKNNINSLLGPIDYNLYSGSVFINDNDYQKLYNRGVYQVSIYTTDDLVTKDVASELEKMGFNPLVIKDTLYNEGSQIIRIAKTIVTIMLVGTLFFISYFIIKIILKSRNVYFSTIRMLGGSKKVSKQLLIIELLTVTNLVYLLFTGFVYLNKINILNVSFVNDMANYLKLGDYIILYLILIGMSYLISLKYAKKLFKDTVIKTLREEI